MYIIFFVYKKEILLNGNFVVAVTDIHQCSTGSTGGSSVRQCIRECVFWEGDCAIVIPQVWRAGLGVLAPSSPNPRVEVRFVYHRTFLNTCRRSLCKSKSFGCMRILHKHSACKGTWRLSQLAHRGLCLGYACILLLHLATPVHYLLIWQLQTSWFAEEAR